MLKNIVLVNSNTVQELFVEIFKFQPRKEVANHDFLVATRFEPIISNEITIVGSGFCLNELLRLEPPMNNNLYSDLGLANRSRTMTFWSRPGLNRFFQLKSLLLVRVSV